MGLRHWFKHTAKVLKRGFKTFGAKGAAEEAEGLAAKGNEKAEGPSVKVDARVDPDGTDRNAGGEE